jgi:hypothetical protein
MKSFDRLQNVILPKGGREIRLAALVPVMCIPSSGYVSPIEKPKINSRGWIHVFHDSRG